MYRKLFFLCVIFSLANLLKKIIYIILLQVEETSGKQFLSSFGGVWLSRCMFSLLSTRYLNYLENFQSVLSFVGAVEKFFKENFDD